MHIIINHKTDKPIYQQIVDSIDKDIRVGKLPAGYKLPTVRELSEKTSISRGTVKHAYDTLEQLGLIEKTQGRGTFVNQVNESNNSSKKDQAMTAIDNLLELMDDLSFSPRDIRIFLDLKLRQWEQSYQNVRVGFIDCSPEALSVICGQASSFPHVDVYEFLLDTIVDEQRPFDSKLDLLITTTTHFKYLSDKLALDEKLMPMVISISPTTVAELARIPSNTKVGILCASRRFAEIIASSCTQYCILDSKPEIAYLGDVDNIADFIASKDQLILPPNHLQFCSYREQTALKEHEQIEKPIIYQYQIEKGSLIYLEETIEKIFKNTKSIL